MPITHSPPQCGTDKQKCRLANSPSVGKMVPFCWCDLWSAALELIHVYVLTDHIRLLHAFTSRVCEGDTVCMSCGLANAVRSMPTHLNDAQCVKTRRLPLRSDTFQWHWISRMISLKDEHISEMTLSVRVFSVFTELGSVKFEPEHCACE